MIGNALIYVDYRARWMSQNWDGNVINLQVTDAKERTIELRCLMSARSSGQAFDLRFEGREKLIDFLQKAHPQALSTQPRRSVLSPTARESATRRRPQERKKRRAPFVAPAEP